MTEENNGGDIASGFGDSEVSGPVSDEKAEQMLHGDQVAEATKAVDDAAASGDEKRSDAPGGGGGGAG